MLLRTRPLPFEVPSYSLTGDVLSYQRCGLQYRYYNGSALPPSRPVQMWVGEFTHGVFEESYRYWKEKSPSFPFPSNPTPRPRPANPPVRVPYDIGEFGDRVEARLAASGTNSRSRVIRELAYDRMEAALNLLGPLLFPLITAAEQRINGTRDMPELPQEGRYRQGCLYKGRGGGNSWLCQSTGTGSAAEEGANETFQRKQVEKESFMAGRKAVVLLSGGLDSSTTLAIAREQNFRLYALSFRYGQRHEVELEAAGRIATAIGVLCGSAHQIARLRVQARRHPINRAKARTLNSAFQIADEGAIKTCLQMEFHLREPKFLSHGPHYVTKRPFHASPGLNLFSTFGHLGRHGAPLSAVGQRVVTDKLEENSHVEEG